MNCYCDIFWTIYDIYNRVCTKVGPFGLRCNASLVHLNESTLEKNIYFPLLKIVIVNDFNFFYTFVELCTKSTNSLNLSRELIASFIVNNLPKSPKIEMAGFKRPISELI